MLIIDGHNLVPKIPGMSLDSLDDEHQLITLLNDYCARMNKSAEVFFDKAAPGWSGRSRIGRLQVVFVPELSSADNAIIQRLNRAGKSARNLTVVTSDHRIQMEARSKGAAVVKSEDFARELVKAFARKPERSRKTTLEKELSASEVDKWLKIFSEGKEENKRE